MRFLILAIALTLTACVGDSNPTPDGGSDATTNDACVAISSQPGVDCFNGNRCTPETQTCCVGLTGSGIIGSCSDAGTCGLATQPYFETWTCDKSFDCPAQAPKCCAGQQATQTLFGGLNSGGCPLQLHVSVDAGADDGGSDGGPPIFTIALCQASCPSIQLCATPAECGASLRCVPVEFQQSSFSKTFGVCLP